MRTIHLPSVYPLPATSALWFDQSHRCRAIVDKPSAEDPGEALEHSWGCDHFPEGQAVWLWQRDRVGKESGIILQQRAHRKGK